MRDRHTDPLLRAGTYADEQPDEIGAGSWILPERPEIQPRRMNMEYDGLALDVGRRQYVRGTATAGLEVAPTAPAGPLETAARRIHMIADGAEQIAARLREHADGVFGTVPEEDARKNAPTPTRSGQIGSLHDALDRMERVLGYVAEQTKRNCTLA